MARAFTARTVSVGERPAVALELGLERLEGLGDEGAGAIAQLGLGGREREVHRRSVDDGDRLRRPGRGARDVSGSRRRIGRRSQPASSMRSSRYTTSRPGRERIRRSLVRNALPRARLGRWRHEPHPRSPKPVGAAACHAASVATVVVEGPDGRGQCHEAPGLHARTRLGRQRRANPASTSTSTAVATTPTSRPSATASTTVAAASRARTRTVAEVDKDVAVDRQTPTVSGQACQRPGHGARDSCRPTRLASLERRQPGRGRTDRRRAPGGGPMVARVDGGGSARHRSPARRGDRPPRCRDGDVLRLARTIWCLVLTLTLSIVMNAKRALVGRQRGSRRGASASPAAYSGQARTMMRSSVMSSIAQRRPSRPWPESFTPPYGMWSIR